MLRNQFSKAFALCFTQKIANIATKAWMLNPCDERSDMLSFEISLMKIKNCIASSISAILFFAPPAQAFSVMHFSLCAHLRSITCGVWRPSRLTLRQWTSGYVRSERCTGRSKWQHHVRSFPLYPSINAELEAGQAAITVFQVLGMTPPGIERSLRGRCKTCCTT